MPTISPEHPLHDPTAVAAAPMPPLLAVPDAGRTMGMWVLGSRGSGKSRLVGRAIIWQDFLRGIPTIVFDPIGGTIGNALDKIIRLGQKDLRLQRAAWRQVRYVDMAGAGGYVVPFPLLYEASSPYFASQRFVELIRRTDPGLTSASILGFNAVKKIATDVGMVLYALGWQFTEAEALLRDPRAYESRIREAIARYPEIAGAASYLLDEYPQLRPSERDMQTSAFLRKIAILGREPTMAAIYGADRPGLTWDEIVEQRLLVLFDFSRVPDGEKQFAMLWLYGSLIEWIKLKRGIGRHRPLGIVLDELTYMVGNRNQRDDILARDLNQLISVISRNSQLWITAMNQEMNQLSEELQDALMTMGTQLYGSTTDPDAAQKVARRFYPYEPYRVKKTERVWGSDLYRGDYVRDERTVEFGIPEQLELNSRRLLALPRLTFLAGVSPAEGTMPTRLRRISIAGLDRGQYPEETSIRDVQERLMRRDGRKIGDILAAIAQRPAGTQAAPVAVATDNGDPIAEAPRPVSERRVPRRSRS